MKNSCLKMKSIDFSVANSIFQLRFVICYYENTEPYYNILLRHLRKTILGSVDFKILMFYQLNCSENSQSFKIHPSFGKISDYNG